MNTRSSSRPLWIWLAPVGLALALLGGLLAALPARAVSFNPCVHPTGAGSCYTTIQAAVTGLASGTTITIAAGTYPEHVIVGTKVFTFIGAGADSTFVDGSNTGRVFSITATSATFADLTIQHGKVISDSGGGIYASGALTLTNVNVLSNTVAGNATNTYNGGGVRVRSELRVTGGRFENNLVTGGGEGGAICSNAPTTIPTTPHPTMTISDTTFISNTATYGGGVSFAAGGWFTNTQFISNSATARGGGLFNNSGGTLTLSGGRFERNVAGATGRGGGVFFAGAAEVNSTRFINNTAGGTGGGARINGAVTLIDAEFTGNSATGGQGGGLYAGNAVTLTNGAFTGNRSTVSGGGVYVGLGGATVTGTHFISNSAGSDGGGMYVSITSTVISAQFFSNTAGTRGGGLFTEKSLTLIDADFLSNTALSSGGGLYIILTATVTGGVFLNNGANSSGGGLYVGSGATLTGTQFISNTAGGDGGGLWVNRTANLTGTQFISNTAGGIGGGLYSFPNSRMLTLVDTEFRANTAITSGGGVYAHGPVTVDGAEFTGNSATDASSSGGGLFAYYYLVMTDTQLIHNSAANGGGIYVFGGTNPATSHMVNVLLAANTASTNGAALYLYPSNSSGNPGDRTATIVHTTIASPTVGASQAIFVGKPPTRYTPTVNITNTLIASYTTGISVTAGVTFTSDYNFFFNAPTTEVIGSHSISGVHFLLFADATGDDYRPALGSPAPTHGLYLGIAADLDGSRRPLSGPDTDPPTIGAYEGTPYPYLLLSKTVTPTSQITYHSVVTYTIELNNAGSLTDTVFFTDALPTGVTFGGWVENHGASETDNTITWSGTIVDLTAVDTFVFTATHTGGYGVVITNTALVSGLGQASSAAAAFSVEAALCDNTIAVQNHGGSGAGSLRQAIADLCPGGTITFGAGLSGATVLLSTELVLDKNLTISSSAPITVSGGGSVRVFAVNSGVAATLDGLTIFDGSAGDGGGIYNAGALTLANSMVVSNAANTAGGGIYSEGVLTITASTIASNTVSNNGGGIYMHNDATLTLADSSVAGNAAGYGAGLYVGAGALVAAEHSTFSNNRAGFGGGGIASSGALAMANSTVSGNRALGGDTGDGGGGIYNDGVLTVTNSTLAGNTSSGPAFGAGLHNADTGDLAYRNTIIADSSVGPDCFNSGAIGANTNNLVEDGACSATSSGDPQLGILGDYGGDTETLPLLPGSAAFDAGDATTCAATPVDNLDQRGVARPQGVTCDIGAFESRGFTLIKGAGDGQSAAWGAAFAAPLTVVLSSSFTEPVDGGQLTFVGPIGGAGTNPVTNTATIAGGVGAYTPTANSTVGSYSFSASASGANPAVSFGLTNTLRSSNAVLEASPNPSVFGQAVTFTATVTASSGTPSGAVIMEVDDIPVFTGTLSGGAVSYATSGLAVGTHPVYAEYLGDANYEPSESAGVTQTVLKATAAVTLSNLSQTYDGTPKPATATTAPVSLTVALTYNGGGSPPSTAGSYTVVGTVDDASYTGVATDTLVIAQAATTTTLTSAPNPSLAGASVTFTATVTIQPSGDTRRGDATGSGRLRISGPTGNVTFKDGASDLGTVALTNGVATFRTSSLSVGSHAITAVYAGDSNHATNTSSVLTQVVNPGVTAHNDAGGTAQGAAVTLAVLPNDSNPAGGALALVAVGPSTHGGATAITADAQTVIYTPTAIFTGTDCFTYTVQDINQQTSTAQVAVVVSAQQETEQPPQVAPADPAVGGTGTFSSTQAGVDVALPAGFYTGTFGPTDVFYLAYTPVTTPTHTGAPGGWMFGDYVFTMLAYVNDTAITPMTFAAPVTVTLVYSPAQFDGIELDTLMLHAWDGSAWSTAGIWLVEHITPTHTLVYTITHLTEFGLLGRPTPTAAALADVSTQVAPDAVTLHWNTASERDLLGFHLYRGATVDDPGVRLNGALIPAQGAGSPDGYAYSFEDAVAMPPGTAWFYWIETVDFAGAATRHGPYAASAPADPGVEAPRAFLPLVQVNAAAAATQEPADARRPEAPPPEDWAARVLLPLITR